MNGQDLGAKLRHAMRLAGVRSPVAELLRAKVTNPILNDAVRVGRAKGWENAGRWLLSSEGSSVLRDPRLLHHLQTEINLDVETELVLTEARKCLLCFSPELVQREDVQNFACALIQQCILNEYVFFVSDEEKDRLRSLSFDGGQIASGSEGAIRDLFLWALYHPIDAHMAKELQGKLHVLADPLRVVIESYVREKEQEHTFVASIERLGSVEDEVSREVAAQYEANPYPRWLRMDVAPKSRCEEVSPFFKNYELAFFDRPFDVLVAGCATGKAAIRCAIGFGENANVVAIDLSSSALGYASRMAQVHGAQNIRFIQADILALPALGQQFDVVECSGVLHHMRNPLEGWRALTDRLRPGGIMHIGLYSELARREVAEIREHVANENEELSADYIRTYRRKMMLGHDVSTIWRYEKYFPFCADFFSLSNCRDLFFNVIEHRYTISQIKENLATLGLEFRGFLTPEPLPSRYWTTYPAATDLDAWWEFEQKHPETFVQMYQFWCRKRPTNA